MGGLGALPRAVPASEVRPRWQGVLAIEGNERSSGPARAPEARPARQAAGAALLSSGGRAARRDNRGDGGFSQTLAAS